MFTTGHVDDRACLQGMFATGHVYRAGHGVFPGHVYRASAGQYRHVYRASAGSYQHVYRASAGSYRLVYRASALAHTGMFTGRLALERSIFSVTSSTAVAYGNVCLTS